MVELKNHRSAWTNQEDETLIQAVITSIENGETQRDAFKVVSEKIGRTVGAVEYHWKKIRKESEVIQEQFQGALAYALIDAVNDPHDPQTYPQDDIQDAVIQEITKGATKIHQMIKQIMNPNDPDVPMIPPEVAHEMAYVIESQGKIGLYDQKYLASNEFECILDYIQKPQQARNYFQAIEKGYDIEMRPDQKIRTIYDTLNLIKPNEPGYMMARGMIVMMYHVMDILDIDAVYMMKGASPDDLPF
jgi:hypothetical protein